MLPLVFVCADTKKTEKFISDFTGKNQILKSHIFYVRPLKKEIGISQIKMIKREINFASTHLRLFVLYQFDIASIEAQNAFLKILEEQSPNNRFILVVENEHALLPTILSRTIIVNWDNLGSDKFSISEETYALMDLMFSSFDPSFLNSSPISGITRDKATALFDELIHYFRPSNFRFRKKAASILKKLLQLKKFLEVNNINSQLAVDNALIFVWKQFRIKL